MSVNLGPLKKLSRIQVSDDIYIELDQKDTWISICDEDWARYDQAGACIFNAEDIDELISKLQEAKQLIRAEVPERIE